MSTTPSPLNDPEVMKETIEVVKSEYGPEVVQDILKQKSKIKGFTILNWSELKEYNVPTYRWRVQDLIQDKKIIIVGGPSAVYKSWMTLDLGISVALGMPFLDNFPVEKGNVLFIDRENSIPELQNRVEMICSGKKLPEDINVNMYFISEQSLQLDDSTSRVYFEQIINDYNIKLVIIDTYRRVVTFQENDANAVSIFFTEALKPICERTGCSFILIHHHKKGPEETDPKNMLRGSSDLVNFVDGIIQISRKGPELTVTQSKNRSGAEIEPFQIRIDTDEEEYFKLTYIGEKRDYSLLSKAVTALNIWISKENISEFKTKQARLVCQTEGIKKMKFFEAIQELEKRGIIIKAGHGSYKVNQNSAAQNSPIVQHISSGPSDNSSSNLPIEPIEDHSSNKSNSLDSPNGQIGQYGLSGEINESDRDTQYYEDDICKDIVGCELDDVLDYINDYRDSTLDELVTKFGPGVLKFKKQGLIKCLSY